MPSFNTLFPRLQHTVDELRQEFSLIPDSRKAILRRLADFALRQRKNGHAAVFNFICTHNSRRSLLAQLWAQAAAHAVGAYDVRALSGGTEATAFNPRAVRAMEAAGFQIRASSPGANPVYKVRFAADAPPVLAFSKTYDDPVNAAAPFAAVMTCSHADEHCPFIPGAAGRIALTYDDPKAFDNTPEEAAGYAGRVRQIGREMLYAFSLL